MNVSIELIIVVLSSISLLVFILSFFKKDPYDELEKQIETVTIQFMQENYQLKKRLKLIEEELLGTQQYDQTNINDASQKFRHH